MPEGCWSMRCVEILEIFHFWLNFFGEARAINAITLPSNRQWSGSLVTDLVVYLNNNWEMIFQNVFADQLLPQREISGVLLLPIFQLVCLPEPSWRMWRSFSRIQSKVLSPWQTWCWSRFHNWDNPLEFPRIIEVGVGYMTEG